MTCCTNDDIPSVYDTSAWVSKSVTNGTWSVRYLKGHDLKHLTDSLPALFRRD